VEAETLTADATLKPTIKLATVPIDALPATASRLVSEAETAGLAAPVIAPATPAVFETAADVVTAAVIAPASC
jgi:hypothetical protein